MKQKGESLLTFTEDEIDEILDRYDKTIPRLKRLIVVSLLTKLVKALAKIDAYKQRYGDLE